MKALALAAAFALAPAAASAGTLIAGAARDTDGFVVAGATVVARAAGGQIVGRAMTAADGTFAIDADGTATVLDLSCRFCVSQTVALTDQPPAIVVVRYAALRDRTLSSDDIAALPYDHVTQVASLVPYTVATGYGISDRGLAAGQGATAIDGISYYRISDGRTFLGLVPNGALDALSTQPAGLATSYGQPAQGGLFNAATLGDQVLALRAGGDGAGGVLRLMGPAGAASFAESSFDGSTIRRATGRLDAPFAGGSLSFVASAAGNGVDATDGAALQYAAALAHADAFASLSAGQSRSALLPALGTFAGGSDVRADAHLHGHDPNGWDVGVRATTSAASGPAGITGTQGEYAFYGDAQHDGPQTTLRGAVAVQGDVESAGPERWSTDAILPSFSFEERLGGGFALNASTTAAIRDPYLEQFAYATVTTEPAYFVRTDVVDAGLSYTDGRRIRIDGVAYVQRAGDLADTITGIGLNAAWQVTPQFALRTWALAAVAGADIDLAPAVTYTSPAASTPLRQQVLWLTYRNGLRVDLLDRGNGLDGSVDLPFGHGYSFVAGTYGRLPGRVVTVDLRATR